MHVFLTGATGFVGSYVLDALIKAGHSVRCLMRDTEKPLGKVGPDAKIEKVKGDVTNPKSLTGLIRGCDAVIHLVGIIKEDRGKGVTFENMHHKAAVHVADEARDSGIDTFILMSANGVREKGVSAYQSTKWKAEQYVKKAGFKHWAIFRPAVIFGKPAKGQPEFSSQLVDTLIAPFPVLPVFGDGQYKMQPVSVEDVAAAFVQALSLEKANQKTYTATGPDVFTYSEILDVLATGAGMQPKMQIKQPLWLVRPVIHTVGQFDLLPITPDQFEMLIEGNTGDSTAFFEDFDLPKILFNSDSLAYLKR